MDATLVQDPIALPRGSLLRMQDASGVVLHVLRGSVWVTQEGDRRDHYIGPGEHFRLDRGGVTVVAALRRSCVRVIEPVPAGWGARLRHRFERVWLHAYAPRSLPTTAAL